MSDFVDVDSLWKVLAVGLIGGAGLVAVFAFGLVGLSAYADRPPGARPKVLGLVLACACFLVVAGGAAAGLVALLAK
ncbi:hypothetical protein ABGB17_38035 [Sphaerisporangium sp. B11E5]|uniref:hypothetical protein n=1 Tax=Sphaerisporangium sp. B11E5 TaxID=3153563 RepID=UPI00325EFAD7